MECLQLSNEGHTATDALDLPQLYLLAQYLLLSCKVSSFMQQEKEPWETLALISHFILKRAPSCFYSFRVFIYIDISVR